MTRRATVGHIRMCCGVLAEDEGLMRAGLVMVVVGHAIFLLGALVHGIVLRPLSPSKQAHVREYTAANVAALVAGLVGIIMGISTIIVPRNKRSRTLVWFLLGGSLPGALLAAGSALGVTVTLAKTVVRGRHSLLLHCQSPNVTDVPGDCPFNPTHIYGTALALWLPLLVMCAVESVYLGRCSVTCMSILRLPRPPCPRQRTFVHKQQVSVRSPEEATSDSRVEPQGLAKGPQHHWVEPMGLEEEPQQHWAEPEEEEPPERHIPLGRRPYFNRSSLCI
ncbi:transmembrane protein 54b isoform X1 [Scleropages formosus]|uniref:transmembrane protein 54b isoform X1 n=1 Tax=Scleropages formosus TaxID=113540 RepID=UPI0010FAAF69|nr:transmembrane protein 54-like isoform X1 [Scleropages formosus]